MPTMKIPDTNGWYEIKNNPLSKAGVFPYRGSSIGAPDPSKIYQVYRPAEELSHPDCIDSFKLLPWIDDHTMLGAPQDGLTPAEMKGVQGTTGEDIKFQHPLLLGNIKVYSEQLKNKIAAGKKQLSAGYRCVYLFESGQHDGQPYDAIQTEIRGNHLALVKEGRMGPDVAVMDRMDFFTIDSRELEMTKKDDAAEDKKTGADAGAAAGSKASEISMPDLLKRIDAMASDIESMKSSMSSKSDDDGEDAKDKKGEDKKSKDDDDMEGEDKKCADKKMEDKKGEDKKSSGTDAAEIASLKKQLGEYVKGGAKAIMGEISKRDNLARKLSTFVGTFDASEMTLDEVAEYGVKKLKLEADKGHEHSVLNGFLAGRVAPHKAASVGFDAGSDKTPAVSSAVSAYIAGK